MDDFEKVLIALKYLNLKLNDPSVEENFQDRFILQKLTYLLMNLGIKMNYRFSLYKSGPYCPELTKDYYNNSWRVVNLDSRIKPFPREIKIFNQIKDEILTHPLYEKYSAALLEAISTAYYIKKGGLHLTEDIVFRMTKEEKPYLSDKIVLIAINIVKKLMFKPKALTKDIQNELDIWDKSED
ncbi:MAG: hypothetical protein ACFFDB_20285 [Promethearchaeota archaeon]